MSTAPMFRQGVDALIRDKGMVLKATIRPGDTVVTVVTLVPRQFGGHYLPGVDGSERVNVPINVLRAMAQELAPITDWGTPPPKWRKPGEGWRFGWREMGLPELQDGETYYLYAQ